jgi:hypothetical protein
MIRMHRIIWIGDGAFVVCAGQENLFRGFQEYYITNNDFEWDLQVVVTTTSPSTPLQYTLKQCSYCVVFLVGLPDNKEFSFSRPGEGVPRLFSTMIFTAEHVISLQTLGFRVVKCAPSRLRKACSNQSSCGPASEQATQIPLG